MVSFDKKKILIVDDDLNLSDTLINRFDQEGYVSIGTRNGEEGLSAAITEKPNLILTDIIMPKMQGIKMLKKLKENDKTKNIPVIVFSSLSDPIKIEEATEAGADEYFIKCDVGIEEIIQKVKEFLTN